MHGIILLVSNCTAGTYPHKSYLVIDVQNSLSLLFVTMQNQEFYYAAWCEVSMVSQRLVVPVSVISQMKY